MEKIFILLSAVFLFGCATINKSHGGREVISIDSSPTGAQVKVLDRFDKAILSGKTPYTAILATGEGYFQKAVYKIIVEKDGYLKEERILSPVLDAEGYFCGNACTCQSFYGWFLADPLSGGMWHFSQEDKVIDVTLKSIAEKAEEEKVWKEVKEKAQKRREEEKKDTESVKPPSPPTP